MNQKAAFIKKSNDIVVIGASAGGIIALKTIFGQIKKPLNCPVLVVIHRPKQGSHKLDEVLGYSSNLTIKEATNQEPMLDGIIYLAASNHHLLVENDGTLSLSLSDRVNFSRPSIDVTFYNVVKQFGNRVTGIILTGANEDGAFGLGAIASAGGKTIVQKPQEAQISVMPEAALKMAPDSKQLTLHEISNYLLSNFSS
ncbi:chemotaxis protein CheB [Owenweeksia hongkongensis]|uniref:chemotaxis protein CheB n=1 Tax=Owenweeksia hongkongensis TaxID=253245 RepID=UPI003A95B14E